MIMFENEDKVKKSIVYFNRLSDKDKAIIVSDLNPRTFKLKHHFNSLFPLLSKVQRLLSKHDGIKIGNRLVELGLEETYARLIVSNMKKHAPTMAYQLNQLQLMKDDAFSQLEEITNAIWIDHDDMNAVVEKYGITSDQFHSIAAVTNSVIINLLRGDVTEKGAIQKFVNKGLSKARSEQLLSAVQSHKDAWRSTVTFSNLQDVYFKMQKIEEQNYTILTSIMEIIKLLKIKSN